MAADEAPGDQGASGREGDHLLRVPRHPEDAATLHVEVFGFAPDVINGDTAASAKHSASRQKRIDAFQAQSNTT